MSNAATVSIDIAMSTTRLYEALKAEARRTNDPVLVRRWNDYCFALQRKLDAAKKATPATAWFYGQSWHAAR